MAFVIDESDPKGKVVDLERDVALLDRPQPAGDPHELELIIKAKKITLEVISGDKRREDGKLDVHWQVIRVRPYGLLSDEREKIIKLVTEALEVYGFLGRQKKTNSVSVDFNQAIWEHAKAKLSS